MVTRVLEVNVDDLYSGGVFSLIKNIIINNSSEIKIDIASLEHFVNHKNIEELSIHNSQVYYFGYDGSKVIKQFATFKNLKKILKEHHYDYVHIHSDTAVRLFIYGMAAKKMNKKNIILHSHASGVDGDHRFIKKTLHFILRPLLKNIGTNYIACSERARKWMFPNVKKERVSIIYNGIDIEKFKFNKTIRDKIRNELKLTNELLIGHIGRFDYVKNHVFMLKIASYLKEKKVNFKYLFVGNGPLFLEIVEKSKSLDVYDKCIFLGECNNVNELYQAMDVFTLPSKSEGYGICAIEAQTSGLPSIFSHGIPEEVKVLDSVKYLDIEDNDAQNWVMAIEEMTKTNINREQAHELLYGQKLSIENTVKNLLNIYSLKGAKL